MIRCLAIILLTWLPALPATAQDFVVEEVATLPDIPWGMDFISRQRLIVTLRSGQAGILDLDDENFMLLSGLPRVADGGQGGLLDTAISPDFAQSGRVYFTYSKPTDRGSVTTLARARLESNRLVDWRDLLVTDSATDTGRHFGSRIAFDDKGHVYFGVGDRGVRGNAQNLANHAGSILRLTLDGQTPPDNPFVGQAGKRDEIWSYGHRNPQGLVYDDVRGLLWEIEHGPRGGDEINIIRRGRNYGWPVISYGKEYWGPISVGEGTEKAGMEQPEKVYTPSIAPGSLLLYRGDAFPEWRGDLFAGALKLQHLNRLSVDDDNRIVDEQRLLGDVGERIRALTESAEGWIYLSTDSGKILRLKPR